MCKRILLLKSLLPVAFASPWPATEKELIDNLGGWSVDDVQAVTTADVEDLVGTKRWVEAARLFVLKRREAGVDDLEPTVRQSVKKIKGELDDLVRSLDKNYGQAQQISPAFQWAQNNTHVFMSVKFAARWNAPGALQVQNATVAMDDKNLFFSGVGEHSMIVKNYTLSLILNEPCKLADWGPKSVGRMSITLEKNKAKKWPSLLDASNPKIKYGVWHAMQEQLDKEQNERQNKVDAAKNNSNSTKTDDKDKDKDKDKDGKKKKKKKKKSKKKKEEEDDEDDDMDDLDACDVPGIYESSKVKPLCQKNFDKTVAKTGPWLIKFFDEHPDRQKQTHELVHIWKHLASTLPLQHCHIGVVDCKKDKNLCNRLQVTDKVPVAMRYAEAGADPVRFEGEVTMETLAEFAVKGEQKKQEL